MQEQPPTAYEQAQSVRLAHPANHHPANHRSEHLSNTGVSRQSLTYTYATYGRKCTLTA